MSSERPEIIGAYFKWHHEPTRGNSVVLPTFRREVELWWSAIQPEWRYKNETPKSDYSYILAGGQKGVFLFILCLAWWDRAYGRDMEREKAERRAAAQTAGKDATTLDFSDIPDHDYSWFNIVNDLIFAMERAKDLPVPIKGEKTTRRRKRTTEGSLLPQKRAKKTKAKSS